MLAAILLAAGASHRMGCCKQLLPWRSGRPVICHMLEQLQSLRLAATVVVVGSHYPEIDAAVQAYPVTLVQAPAGTQRDSLQAALHTLVSRPGITAALVMPADLPLISAELLHMLVMAYHPGMNLVPYYHNQPGHPVIFARSSWSHVLKLTPDQRPHTVFSHTATRRINLACPSIVTDIDTPEQYQALLAAR